MKERIIDNEKLKIVSESFIISDANQLATEEIAYGMALQVSKMIGGYIGTNLGEMLPKSPEEILDQFYDGYSVFVATNDYGNGNVGKGIPTVLYHGTIYPAFENGETRLLGANVVEFGSAIAHSDFRFLGLGKIGADKRMYVAQEKWRNVVCLSTVKQDTTAWSLDSGAEMKPVSFWKHPYLSYLTCTCSNCSERSGFTSCNYRRSKENSDDNSLAAILDRNRPPGPIKCTMILNGMQAARNFEERCKDLHQELLGGALIPGVITVESMAKAKAFFDKVMEVSNGH